MEKEEKYPLIPGSFHSFPLSDDDVPVPGTGVAARVGLDVSSPPWTDHAWQLRHVIRSVENFEHLTGITINEDDKPGIRATMDTFPMSITPYYASLIRKEEYKNDPVFKQCFPDPEELHVVKSDMADPLHEDADSPVEGITHRYPDRVLFLVSNMCSMYCRHCTRKRKVGDVDFIPSREQVQRGLDYIKQEPRIRDVLLSGGDPFLLPDAYLDWILSELHAIPHVEVVRIGTRVPVVLPYRVTPALVDMLRKHHPLWINTHFNHPRELTGPAKTALALLADAGIPLGNQTVLLAGVNDCPQIMKKLNQKLVQNRVRPYYLYQCDLSEGLSHFRTPIGKGIEIMESLIGHTSGFAVPTYVVDAPGGGGKIPISPTYIISWSTNKVILRNYEGVITTYKEPDSYEPLFCDRNCDGCSLDLKLDETVEPEPVGIERLLCESEDDITLTPEGNHRAARSHGGE